MTWCDADQVAELIRWSIAGDDLPRRSAADAHLREVRKAAVNIGDVLITIASGTTASGSGVVPPLEVRFVAAMMLEGMTSRSAWREGTGFSDKPAVASRLVQLLETGCEVAPPVEPTSHSAPMRPKLQRQVLESVARSAAQVCAAELPTAEDDGQNMSPHELRQNVLLSPWYRQLQVLWEAALSPTPSSVPLVDSAHLFLLHAATLGRQNKSLWQLMANEGMMVCLQALQAAESASSGLSSSSVLDEFIVRVAAALSSKTPVDPAIFESFLYHGDLFVRFRALQRQRLCLEQLYHLPAGNEEQNNRLAVQCDATIQLLTYFLHTPKRCETHVPLVQELLATLSAFGPNYPPMLQRDGDATKKSRASKLVPVLTEMLELIQSILDNLASSDAAWMSEQDVFQALLWCMVEADDDNDEDGVSVVDETAAEEAFVTGVMEAEELVLAGCGSGSPKSVALSLTQMMIERAPACVDNLIDSWLATASGVPTDVGHAPYWNALASAVAGMAQQLAASNENLLDAIAGERRHEAVYMSLTTAIQAYHQLLVEHYAAAAVGSGATTAKHAAAATTLQLESLLAKLIFGLCRVSKGTSTTEAVALHAVEFFMKLAHSEGYRRGGTPSIVACVSAWCATELLLGIPGRSSDVELSAESLAGLLNLVLWVGTGEIHGQSPTAPLPCPTLGGICGSRGLLTLLATSADSLATVSSPIWGDPRIVQLLQRTASIATTFARGSLLGNVVLSMFQAAHHHSAHVPVAGSVSDSDGHARSGALEALKCGEVGVLLRVLVDNAATASDRRSIYVRSICDIFSQLVQQSMQAPGCQCHAALAALAQCVARYTVEEVPHDDSFVRALSSSLSTSIAAGLDHTINRACRDAALCVFKDAADPLSSASAQGVSNAMLALTLAVAAELQSPATSPWCAPEAMGGMLQGYLDILYLHRHKKSSSLHATSLVKDVNNPQVVSSATLLPAMCATYDISLLARLLLFSAGGSADPAFPQPHTQLSPAVVDFVEWWCSTLVFSERRTQIYSLVAVQKLLASYADTLLQQQAVLQQTVSSPSSAQGPTSFVYRLFRTPADKAPSESWSGLSLLQLILLSLAHVCYFTPKSMGSLLRLQNGANQDLFSHLLSPNRVPWLGGSSAGTDAASLAFLQCTSSEGAAQILRACSETGNEALRSVAQCASEMVMATVQRFDARK